MFNQESREIAAKDVVRNWGEVREHVHDGPVFVNTYGRRSLVILTYKDYETLRRKSRQAMLTSELPAETLMSIAADLQAATETVEDGDTIIG